MAYPEKAARSVDELRRANVAINQRLEAQEDSYRAQGMGDEEMYHHMYLMALTQMEQKIVLQKQREAPASKRQ